MIIINVSYTVKKEFVDENLENIKAFISDLKAINNPDIRYHVYTTEDGKKFVHLSHYKDEKAQKQLLDLPSFKFFQDQRDRSGLETYPVVEKMELQVAL